MVARGVRSQGTGRGIDALPGWTDAKVMVEFGTVPYGFGGDTPFLTLRHEIGASGITMPGRAYAVSGVPLEHDIAISMAEIHFSITLYQVPTVNLDVYAALAANVNNATFLGRPAETVRFDGLQSEFSQTITFTTTHTVTLKFAFRPRSWNQIMLPSGVWATPLNVNDGSKAYTPSDLSPLLY